MTRKKKPSGPKPRLLPARPPEELRKVLQEYADRERRSLSQAVVLLLEEALTLKGLWPPPGEGGRP